MTTARRFNPHAPDWDLVAPDDISLADYAAAWIDMEPHIATLTELARQCHTIVEFGLRGAVSTWALLDGLPDDGELCGVDINPNAPIPTRVRADRRFRLMVGDSVTVPGLPPVADMVMIDSSHEFTQTVLELHRAELMAPRWIVCHDYLYEHTPQVRAAIDGFTGPGYIEEPRYRIEHIEQSKWGLAILTRR